MRSQERLCVVGPLVRAGCTHVYASRGGSAHRPGSCHARPRHAYPGQATRAGDRPRSSMASLRIARAVTHRRRVRCIGVAAASQASSQTACARQASACRRDGMPTRCQMLQPGVRTCTDPKRCRRIGVAEATACLCRGGSTMRRPRVGGACCAWRSCKPHAYRKKQRRRTQISYRTRKHHMQTHRHDDADATYITRRNEWDRKRCALVFFVFSALRRQRNANV